MASCEVLRLEPVVGFEVVATIKDVSSLELVTLAVLALSPLVVLVDISRVELVLMLEVVALLDIKVSLGLTTVEVVNMSRLNEEDVVAEPVLRLELVVPDEVDLSLGIVETSELTTLVKKERVVETELVVVVVKLVMLDALVIALKIIVELESGSVDKSVVVSTIVDPIAVLALEVVVEGVRVLARPVCVVWLIRK